MRPPIAFCVACLIAACGTPRAQTAPKEPEAPAAKAEAEPTQEELARIAMTSLFDWKEAIPGIEDQKLLADIALGADSFEARRLAAEHVVDREQLTRIGRKGDRWALYGIVDRTDDQGVLERMTRMHWDLLAEKATARITDQRVLARLALGSRWGEVRLIAVHRLDDPGLLLRVALAKDSTIAARAASRLTDPDGLARIVAESESDRVRAAATRNLDDQALLTRLALEDGDERVRLAAVRRLHDADALRRVALADRSNAESYTAIARLADEEVLTEVCEAVAQRKDDENRDSRREMASLRRLLLADCLPPTRLDLDWKPESQVYGYHEKIGAGRRRMPGETVILIVRDEEGTELHRKRLTTEFPKRATWGNEGKEFRRAAIDEVDFFTGLFGAWAGLDLAAIARGPAPLTLRRASIAHLADESLLAELAREEAETGQPLGASDRLDALRR